MPPQAGNFPTPFQSIIKTRARNQDVHPGEPDAKQKRRTAAEMADFRANQALEKKRATEEAQENINTAGTIEDEMRKEDVERQKTNRRYQSDVARFRPQVDDGPELSDDNDMPAGLNIPRARPNPEGSQADEVSDGSNKDCYKPDSSSEVESEDEDEDEPAEEGEKKGTKKRKPKPNRRDISAVRETLPSTGTPILPGSASSKSGGKRKNTVDGDTHPAAKKSKTAKTKHAGVRPGWDSQKTGTSSASSAPNTDDDSMVKNGGMASDEDDRAERAAGGTSNSRMKKPLKPMIKISETKAATHKPVTKKTLRDGHTKWTLKHLPDGMSTAFTNLLVPLAKIKAGTVPAWDGLSSSQVQVLVDEAFGAGTHVVGDEDVWCGLISYRLSNWRNGFGTAAASAVKTFISDNFDDEQAIAEFVGQYTMFHGDPNVSTAPFHWRVWEPRDDSNKIVKKGRFQNSLIMYTLAHGYFSLFDDMPDVCEIDEKPVGALILSLQAVEHAFKSWTTGVFHEDRGPQSYFSSDNYDDHEVMKPVAKGRSIRTKVLRAGKYRETINSFAEKNWADIFEASALHLENSKKRRKSKSLSSRASSEAVSEAPGNDYMLISDEDDE